MTALLTQPIILLLAVGLYAGAGLVTLFVWLENRGRPEVAIGVIFGSLVTQVMAYPIDAFVPRGLFRPGPLRIQELLIGAALVARFLSRDRLPRISPTGFAWLLFCAWYAVCAVMGGLWGNPLSIVLFHGKFIVYAGGCYLLASGVPVRRLLDGPALGRWFLGIGAVVALQMVVTVAGRSGLVGSFPAPLEADAASLFFAIAVLVLLVEGARRGVVRGRGRTLLAAAPLAVCPLVVSQRASVLHLGASLLFLFVIAIGPTWWRRMTIRPTQVLVGVLAVLLVGALISLPKLSQGNPVPEKVTGIVDQTFGGAGKVQSADARKNKWAEGWRMVEERPVMGWGLGALHRFFNPGYIGVADYEVGNTFDNTPLDLMVRSGIVGFLLFSWAMVASMRDAWRVWMHHVDPRVAAVGLAVATFLVGLTAKAVVESVMEKVVLACALGLAVGMIASARADLDAVTAENSLVTSGRAGS